jgi:GntR family transcriptional regulator
MSTDHTAPFSSIRLDKNSPVPIYLQIAEGIGALLKEGVFPPGYFLPSERALCEQFGISRMTLRQAMSLLDREGLIDSHRGRGTIVTPRGLRKKGQELKSFSEEIRDRGGKPESQLLSLEQKIPSESALAFFELADGQKVYEIFRLRLNDGEPLAVELACIPARLCPGLERFDLAKNSLVQILGESYGLHFESCVEEFTAEVPNAQVRKLLGLTKNSAVLVANRKTFADDGRAVELTRSTYRGDRYSAIVHSVRKKNSVLMGANSR